MRSLENLHLEINKLGDAGACTIAGALPSMQSLQYLSLGSNEIGDAGACAIAGALQAHSRCKYCISIATKLVMLALVRYSRIAKHAFVCISDELFSSHALVI